MDKVERFLLSMMITIGIILIITIVDLKDMILFLVGFLIIYGLVYTVFGVNKNESF